MAPNVFSVPVFLVVFREALETVIIVSILLAFLKQTLGEPNHDLTTYKRLRRQVWLGTGIGFFICLVVAAALIGVFYKFGNQAWEKNELYYEGAFSLIACIIITIMGVALLRVGKMQAKWRVKLAAALDSPVKAKRSGVLKRFCEKYAMFILPFVTILREGIEAIVFVAGVSFSTPAKSVPLAVVVGLAVGAFVGWLLYKGGSTAKLQIFLVVSTCVLYVVAAGLFTRTVWYFERKEWDDAIGGEAYELGSGPGSYDIDKSVWHINCCEPYGDQGWGILNALVGWTNSATYGTVISYNVYWIFVMCMFGLLRYKEVKGHWPLMKSKVVEGDNASSSGGSDGVIGKEMSPATEKAL